MSYQTHIFKSGLRLIFMPETSKIVYCGVVVDVGSRHENENQCGIAHFVEHLLFKGTEKRSATQIINRLENVGGELNAFTAKEETVVYAAVLQEYTERAIELVADIALHSVFDTKQIEREREVILDEIDSYEDSPAELIFDDFEKHLFSNNYALGHLILGEKEFLQKYERADIFNFYKTFYTPQNMTLFVRGNVDFQKIVKWGEKYFDTVTSYPTFPQSPVILGCAKRQSRAPANAGILSQQRTQIFHKNTTQSHIAIGGNAVNMYDADRMAVYLLNNILGGAGMNSLLNLSLREKRGLVYTVEANFQPFTDAGEWCVYFGCDPRDAARCERLVYNELQKLCEKKFSDAALAKYKRQLFGQMAIAAENSENVAIAAGKNYLRYGKLETLADAWKKLETIRAEHLRETARVMFDKNNIYVLKYVP
jgi:predicted Zn-dependent peptidase